MNMRTLIVLRGAPGCGKTTWIKKNNLEEYTLCLDTIRNMMISPRMNHEAGYFDISFKYDSKAWQMLFELLEERMKEGELTLVDAVHSRPVDFSRYKDLAEKYRYRLYCVDFSSIPIEEAFSRNVSRPYYGTADTIRASLENIYARFKSFAIPKYFTVLNPNDSIWDFLDQKPIDVSNYKKIVFIGDIHGCFSPLEKYFNENPFSEENLYVFLGDYFDRGIQNDKVCEWLLNHFENKNVMLLTGNHEKWFISYANEEYKDINECKSTEFKLNTIPQLESFNKKDLRQLSRKFIQCAYLKFNDKKFICTHTGMGFMPTHLQCTASQEMIRGGKYEEDVDLWFETNNHDENLYQVHGHRNMFDHPIDKFTHSFNLNEAVEFGENLRIMEVTK